jgi:hypothetical protein
MGPGLWPCGRMPLLMVAGGIVFVKRGATDGGFYWPAARQPGRLAPRGSAEMAVTLGRYSADFVQSRPGPRLRTAEIAHQPELSTAALS